MAWGFLFSSYVPLVYSGSSVMVILVMFNGFGLTLFSRLVKCAGPPPPRPRHTLDARPLRLALLEPVCAV